VELPKLLDITCDDLADYEFDNLTIVALQHLLPTITHLFDRIIEDGVLPENIHLIGKRYSTIQAVKTSLDENCEIRVHTCDNINFVPGEYSQYSEKEAIAFWAALSRKKLTDDILILDEGGLLRKTIPSSLANSEKRIIGMEHTSSGWNNETEVPYPLILKARSFAKLTFESKFIVKSLVDRLLDELPTLLGTRDTLQKSCKNSKDDVQKLIKEEKRKLTKDEKRKLTKDEKRKLEKEIKLKLIKEEKRKFKKDEKHKLTKEEKRKYKEDNLRKQAEVELGKSTIGIIGVVGHLGFALSRYLSDLGVESILGFDTAPGFFEKYGDYDGHKYQHIEKTSLSELVAKSTIVFGCTGKALKDVHKSLYTKTYQHRKDNMEGLNRQTKVFASCSSGDLEFEPILKLLRNKDRVYANDPFRNATGMIGQYHVVLLNGGFPINFDRVVEREPKHRILLTRELTYASFLQAAVMLRRKDLKKRAVELSPRLQQSVVIPWQKMLAEDEEIDYSGYLNFEQCKEIEIPYISKMSIDSWRRPEGENFDFYFQDNHEQTEHENLNQIVR